MDPDDLDDMIIDVTYETHGRAVTYAPTTGSAVPDVLVCFHDPDATQRQFGPQFGDLEIAEKAVHVLVRASQIAQPMREDLITFTSGPLTGRAFRLGQDGVAHSTREWLLALQSES